MSSTRPTASKKPGGGRPIPKRLFSFDALKKQRSGHDSDDPSNNERQEIAKLVEKPIPENDRKEERWLEKDRVSSPTEENAPSKKTPTPTRELFRARRQRSKPTPVDPDIANARDLPGEGGGGQISPTPSRHRWETIRRHVLPSQSSLLEFRPGSPITQSDTPSTASSAAPTRPSTPKPHRFGVGRKAMRQVVEEARIADVSRKLLEEIRGACWAIRFGKPVNPFPSKMEREVSQGSNPSLKNIPFIGSTASLPLSSNASNISLAMGSKTGLKRPPSIASFATNDPRLSPVTQLATVLTRLEHIPAVVPLEQEVLAALLVPFLDPSKSLNAESEQGLAVETFEFLSKARPPPLAEDELERCLWCFKAASVPSAFRTRILGTLSSILFSPDRPFEADTPYLLQTLFHSMFSLLFELSLSPGAEEEIRTISGWISKIRDGQCGPMAHEELEREYGAVYSKQDDDRVIREAIMTETVASCLDIGSERSRRWALHRLLEDHWPIPEPQLSLTPLLVCIHWRKLKVFLKSTLALLSPNSEDGDDSGDFVIAQLFRTRILPEMDAMRSDDAADLKCGVVRLAMELLCLRQSQQKEYFLMYLSDWYQNQPEWKSSIERTLSRLIEDAEWPVILRLVPTVSKELPDEIQLPVVAFVLPLLLDRLIADPVEMPCFALSDFLEAISRAYPKIFFKPLFTCAASLKELTVATQLQTLAVISKYVPDFWTRDPEMMAVALMSDTSGLKGKASANASPTRGKPRLGQCVLLVELTEHIRAVRHSKDMSAIAAAVKFATVLEARLGIVIEAKEQTTLLSEPSRYLFCALFHELRLLTHSLKPASWLASVVSWCTHWQSTLNDGDQTITGNSESQKTDTFLHKLLAIYIQVQDFTRNSNKRRTTLVSVPPFDKPAMVRSTSGETTGPLVGFNAKIKVLTSISEAPKVVTLELLVAVCGLLGPPEYVRIAPILWRYCFEEDARVLAPVCFLTMQCAEKCPAEFTALVNDDLLSSESSTRVRALEKISILSSWRFQILSQEVILDRSFRRPFKLTRPPILFVATDMGSSSWAYEEDTKEWKDSHGNILPLELRKRLSEIGWDEENRQVDPKMQWIRTPMSLLPSQQLEYPGRGLGDYVSSPEPPSPGYSPTPSPQASPVKTSSSDMGLSRQDSTSSLRSSGVKRRPIFVPTLLTLFPQLAKMVSDRDFSVSSAALDIILDFMRDDPGLIARGIFALFSGEEEDIIIAISTLRAFLHVRHILPPAMAHFVLNHLTGYMKSLVRSTESFTPLQNYAYSISIAADLFTQVSDLSMRELRRNKVDIFFVPTGSLWFPTTTPASPLFPKRLPENLNPFDHVPAPLVWITLIRTAQNRLFVSLLKRNPQDVQLLRKNATRLVLPSFDGVEDMAPLLLSDFIPRKPDINRRRWTSGEVTLRSLSLTVARSYLLLTGQVFQCLSRHLNDRAELSVWMDSISTILLRHGNDVGIVAHCMLVLMNATTRFRRFFTSGGGYTLFMPAVMKVYIEADRHPGIRYAIEYAASRFYALHQETFIFQTLDIMTPVIVSPGIEDAWVASGMYSLFASLERHRSASTVPDAAGIHGLNRQQEREALMLSAAEEVPQTFLASLRGSNNQIPGRNNKVLTVPVPDEYEGKRLAMDNIVRLLLTVIAYNPTSQRAEHFLRVLRLLAPHLYHAPGSTRSVIRDGIVALGNILLTKTKNKNVEETPIQPAENFDTDVLAHGQGPSSVSGRSSDLLAMRIDYLSLVTAFTKPGGSFNHHASQRIIEIVKAILKESRSSVQQVSTFVSDFAKHLLLRDPPPPLKHVVVLLTDLAPVVSAYSTEADFSGLYEVVADLAGNMVFGNERSFGHLVVTQYCRIGLEACDLAASAGLLFTLPLRISLLRLLQNAVCMVGADVMLELERKEPSHEFLAGVILPFTLSLKTAADIMAASQLVDSWRREAHTRAWVRLVTYILNLCRAVDSEGKHSRKSSLSGSEKDRGSNFSSVMTFAIALQILKVIVTRAEKDISTAVPGIWTQMGIVVRTSLSDADAAFAIQFVDYSEPPSPTLSPRVSSFGEKSQYMSAFPSSISMHSRRSLLSPRMVDYLGWSFIHWLWLRRSPLMIQLRLFVQERVATLHEELSQRNQSSNSANPHRSRPISTIFSKPRRSFAVGSAPSSANSTPRNSFLAASMSLPVFSENGSSASRHLKEPVRQPGYARLASPGSPRRISLESNAPRIVHLGPVSPNMALGSSSVSRPTSPGGTRLRTRSVRASAREMMVTSPLLVRMTYRRIRLVQRLMGYNTLLPMNGSTFEEDDNLDAEVKAWSRQDALDAVAQETKDVLEEFRENLSLPADESTIIVDSEDQNIVNP